MLFNWDVSRIQRSFWGQVFEAFATGICVLTVQNPSPELLRIGWILSVCLSVCVCVFVQLFADRFLDQFEQEFNCNFMKRALKKGALAPNSVGEAEHFRVRATSGLPRSLHSPQMATAAPPSPSA